MSWSLLDGCGRRKYLTRAERDAFIRCALAADPETATFCLTLALTGARISEVLALTSERVDVVSQAIIFETLKRRRKGVFRAIPVPESLIAYLAANHYLDSSSSVGVASERIWPFSRITAWRRVKAIMNAAAVPPTVAKPRALRHAFGIEAVRQRIALSLLKKWLGHAKIETTAIYAEPIGEEERELASLLWKRLPATFQVRPTGSP